MFLNIETLGKQDQECSQEWLVNTDPGTLNNDCSELSETAKACLYRTSFNSLFQWRSHQMTVTAQLVHVSLGLYLCRPVAKTCLAKDRS